MDWHEQASPESQDSPETPEAAEVQPEIQPPAEELAPVVETRVEPLPEPLIEAAPLVAEPRMEELPELPVEVPLPVAAPDAPQLVRLPSEMPDMHAAEVPEYPIQEDDDITQEVAMPRYSPIEERIKALTEAITLYPDAPVNYVLRGELILDLGERQAAQEDFRKGLMLAESSADTADWGYVSRALADRARAGLRRC